MLPSAATATGRIGASVPPASTRSHSPARISRSASWKQITLLAQAATCVITGPVMPYLIETWAAAIEPDRAGMAKGETWPGPRRLSVSVPSMTCSMPPPPVLTTTPIRSRSSADAVERSSPAARTASSAAAIAKWMKRLIRRAILRSMATVGSKLFTSAAIRTSNPVGSNEVMGPAPDRPATRLRQKSGAEFPIGVTAPRPVTTARRARSSLGDTTDLWTWAGAGRIVSREAGRSFRPPRRTAFLWQVSPVMHTTASGATPTTPGSPPTGRSPRMPARKRGAAAMHMAASAGRAAIGLEAAGNCR